MASTRPRLLTRTAVGILTVTAAPILIAVGGGTANAAVTCALPDNTGVVHCSDGSYEYTAPNGYHYRKDRHGNIIAVTPPGSAAY